MIEELQGLFKELASGSLCQPLMSFPTHIPLHYVPLSSPPSLSPARMLVYYPTSLSCVGRTAVKYLLFTYKKPTCYVK